MLNFGVIGAGRMGKAHANALKGSKEARIAGVYDPSEAAAKSYVEAFGVEKICSSIEEMACDKALDALVICNFSDQHYDTLRTLLAAGRKRIFCEKALIRQLSEGEDLLKLAQKAGAVVMVGHHRRYIPGYIALRKAILDGRLGTPRMAKAALCTNGYARQWGDFFADFERSGGVILDMMSHIFDQLNWYFGEPESISCLSLMFDRSMPLPADFMSSSLKYKSGQICNVEGAWQRYGVGYDKIEVYGDEATAIFEGGDKLRIYKKGEVTEISAGGVDASKAQMEAFIKMVKTGEEPVNNLQSGFESARVALGAIESAKSGMTFNFK